VDGGTEREYRCYLVATRSASTPPPDPDAPASGFSDEQRNELRDLIAEAVGGAKPPAAPSGPTGPKQVSDGEWDAMSDRSRETWVRQLVDFRLEELYQADEVARNRADIDELKGQRTAQPEASPSVVTKLQRWLWGEPEK
jgi:hypothetical protein